MLKKAINPALFLLLFLVVPNFAHAEVPEWLRTLAKQPAKPYADDVNAVVLLDEQSTVVKENGEIVTHGRVARRILRPEGRDRWSAYGLTYDSDSKVNYLRGWSITSKGQEYEVKEKDAFERTVSSYEVYSDTKSKIMIVPGAEVGTVVGFEYEKKARPYIFQDMWDFQDVVPVEQSRYELHLAPGWRFKSDWVNHDEQKPSEENGALIWQMGGIPRIEREPNQPPDEALAGRMIVTFLSDKMPAKSYRNWSEFGSWYTDLAAGVRAPSPALQQKVQELAPANLPIIERIKRLAGFAQHDVRYVEIKIGVGGYRPHAAGDIFTHRYGDCKDKATVLSSMLDQIGIKSYYLLVRTERGAVNKNSPAHAAFDHMILAIAMPEASYSKPMPAMFEHPKLGHLLIFDPTNDLVPFGQMPYYEQDNYGLLVGEQGGELIHMPLSAPEANGVIRTAKLTLQPDGSLKGDVEETLTGFQAMMLRAYLQETSDKDRKKLIENLLGRSVSNFQVDKFDVVNADEIDKDIIVRYKFSADHYAKNAGALMLVRPRVVGDLAGGWDPNKPRHYAYDFRAPFFDSDSVEITLPEGFKVDELPDPAKTSFPFGEYSSKTESAGNTLKYTREYKVGTTEVPFASIDQLKKLFSQINMDEKNMAVLKRTN
jgi:transglutaminase-like putative cysteine protease